MSKAKVVSYVLLALYALSTVAHIVFSIWAGTARFFNCSGYTTAFVWLLIIWICGLAGSVVAIFKIRSCECNKPKVELASSDREMQTLTPVVDSVVVAAEPKPTKEENCKTEGSKGQKRLRIAGICCGSTVLLLSFLIGWVIMGFFISFRFYSMPDIESTLSLDALQDTVRVERDELGMPHIFAKSKHDAFVAQGFVHAQERFWQMLFYRYLSQGRMSELVGSAGLDFDKAMRTFGFYRQGSRSAECMDADTRADVQAYCDGINEYIASKPPKTVEMQILGLDYPDEWTVRDVATVVSLFQWQLTRNYDDDFKRFTILLDSSVEMLHKLYPNYPSGYPTILTEDDVSYASAAELPGRVVRADVGNFPPEYATYSANWNNLRTKSAPVAPLTSQRASLNKAFLKSIRPGGSNGFAVHGNHTASGKPLLASDPHMTLNQASIWMPMHISCDEFDVIGATIASAPFAFVAQTDYTALAITLAYTDQQDLFVLTPGADPEVEYVVDGVTKKYALVQEEIKVKGEDSIYYSVKLTEFGPVVSDLALFEDFLPKEGSPNPLAFMDVGQYLYNKKPNFCVETLSGIRGVVYSHNWNQMTDTLKKVAIPLSFVYADVHGDIGNIISGFPITRAENAPADIPLPASATYEWKDITTNVLTATRRSPPEGFVVAANNKIFPESLGGDVCTEGDWFEDRGRTIVNKLAQLTANSGVHKVTAQDMANVQSDTVSYLFTEIKPYLSKLEIDQENEQALEWLERMKRFDGDMNSQSGPEAIVWVRWLGKLLHAPAHLAPESDQYWGKVGLVRDMLSGANLLDICKDNGADNCYQFAGKMFVQAVSETVGRRETVAVDQDTFGETFTTHVIHLPVGSSILGCLVNSETCTNGDPTTVHNAGFDYESMEVKFGPSWRMVADMGDQDSCLMALPGGISGHPFSKHYDDSLALWGQRKMSPMRREGYDVEHEQTLSA